MDVFLIIHVSYEWFGLFPQLYYPFVLILAESCNSPFLYIIPGKGKVNVKSGSS